MPENEIQEILKSVNSNISNLELDQLKEDLKIIKFKLQEINDTLEGRILANNIHNKAIEERHIKDGEITADKITLTLDDINDGTNYGRVLSTSISAGKIILSEVNGVIDDIADGTYAKVLSTSLSNGAVLLAKTSGTLDDITNGTNYGKVKITNISAGNILLAQCTGNLDDIADGTNYGKVALTSISAGKIIVAGLDSGITDRMFADLATKNNIQAWRHTTDVTLIDGGKIYTGSIVAGSIAANAIETSKIQAGAVTAGKINVTSLSAIKATLGTVHSGLIYGTRLRVGGGTNEDIYFEDSGIRLYDAGLYTIRFYYSNTRYFNITLSNVACQLYGKTSPFRISAAGQVFDFYNAGTFKLPNIASAPAGANGYVAFTNADLQLKLYTGGAWRHILSSAGW